MAIHALPQDTNAEKLAQTIERLVIAKRMSYLDAVIYYCAEKNIEPELIAGDLGDKIRGELANDAQRLHFIPKFNQLPL
ncbi:uncharacterized protein METZ01_LOCUS158247 [marine metagenome]|uniref:Uncharacterized protein n=1 Tax=marine metagenome TaxID=408172 RepID=A0A382AWL7_9ZZZZ